MHWLRVPAGPDGGQWLILLADWYAASMSANTSKTAVLVAAAGRPYGEMVD
jgi:hypothetical protein